MRGKLKAIGERKRVHVDLPPEKRECLDLLAIKMNCKPSEIMLRALECYAAQHSDEIPLVLQMSGGPEVIEAKKRAIDSYKLMEGPAGAAERAQVTISTIRHWLEKDTIFRQLTEEATQRCVDTVQGRMFQEAQKPGPNSFRDRIAILNAYHADYGIIRPQMLVKILGPFLDRVVECASILTEDTEKLQQFAIELGEYADGVISSQSAGRRR